MRKVEISSLVQKDFNTFDGREKQWAKAIISYLEDEHNSTELIKQKFKQLSGELLGYYKAKHRGFGIRLIFKILNDNELKIYIERIEIDSSINEIIQFIAGGRRDSIYSLAIKRIKNIK